jgi:GGDEF domain-containing protein
MMGTFGKWLRGLTRHRIDGVDRRQNERPPVVEVQAGDIDPASGAIRSDRFMAMVALEQALQPGALLLIDMANSIGPRPAHPLAASESLLPMALAIRQAVRADDLVGHIEGYRFAVLLRGAPQDLAGAIAERIYDSVADTMFWTEDGITQLEIAVGGTVFHPGTGLNPYANAQRALNAAQELDRHRIAIS